MLTLVVVLRLVVRLRFHKKRQIPLRRQGNDRCVEVVYVYVLFVFRFGFLLLCFVVCCVCCVVAVAVCPFALRKHCVFVCLFRFFLCVLCGCFAVLCFAFVCAVPVFNACCSSGFADDGYGFAFVRFVCVLRRKKSKLQLRRKGKYRCLDVACCFLVVLLFIVVFVVLCAFCCYDLCYFCVGCVCCCCCLSSFCLLRCFVYVWFV